MKTALQNGSGELQHRLENLPQELDQYLKACLQSTCGK